MKRSLSVRLGLALVIAASLIVSASAQGQGGGKGNTKKEEKKLNKEAKKLEKAAEEAEKGLGRDSVFCVLAAHTSITGFETGPELKAKFGTLTDFPFGQFVAAVLLVDRLDAEGFGLNEVLEKLQMGMSLGQITKEADVNMGDIRSGFGQFRSELARAQTNPPSKNCFETGE